MPASIATIASGLVRVLSGFAARKFLDHAFAHWQFASGRIFEIKYGHLVAIAATILISWLNYLGIKKAGKFQLIFTILKVVMIVAIVLLGFAASTGGWHNFGTQFAGATGGVAGFMGGLGDTHWGVVGWERFKIGGGGGRDPRRGAF